MNRTERRHGSRLTPADIQQYQEDQRLAAAERSERQQARTLRNNLELQQANVSLMLLTNERAATTANEGIVAKARQFADLYFDKAIVAVQVEDEAEPEEEDEGADTLHAV